MKLEFEKKFIDNFAENIDKQFINDHVYDGGFIWHIFSFNMLDKSKYLSGEKAKEKYDTINKKDALVYLYFEEKEIPINRKYITSKKLTKYNEVYVYSKDFSWCYIKTHEDDPESFDETYGPYFIEKTK